MLMENGKICICCYLFLVICVLKLKIKIVDIGRFVVKLNLGFKNCFNF